MSLDTFNLLVGAGALSLQVLALALFVLYFVRAKVPDLRTIGEWFASWGLWLGFLVTLAAATISLAHAHVFGLPPCDLCWWQRIFIYPQIVLFGIAALRKDASIALYSIALTILGAGIGLYHHALQMFPGAGIPCPATGPSCAQILYLQFGYITYPMLSLSLFAFLFVLMLFVRRDFLDRRS